MKVDFNPLRCCLFYRAWIARNNSPIAHYGLKMWQRHLARRRAERGDARR